MDYSLPTLDCSFVNTFMNFPSPSRRPDPSNSLFLPFHDLDTNGFSLLPSKDTKPEGDSPSNFFEATRQSTDITNFSESSPLDVPHFFSMQPSFQQNMGLSMLDPSPWGSRPTRDYDLFRQILPNSEPHAGYPIYSSNPATFQTLVEQGGHLSPKESSEEDSDLRKRKLSAGGQSEEDDKVEGSLESNIDKRGWSDEDEGLLLKLADQYKHDWKKIAKKFNNTKITANFLKTKYKELVACPLQKRIKFTHQEDLMIASYFEKYGSNWTQMATHFPNRTGVMLKNRYYSYIRKRNLLEDLLREGKGLEPQGGQDQKSEPKASSQNQPMNLIEDNHDFLIKSNMGNNYFEMDTALENELHERITLPQGLHQTEFVTQRVEGGNPGTGNTHKTGVKESMIQGSTSRKELMEMEILRKKVKSLEALCMVARKELKGREGSNKH